MKDNTCVMIVAEIGVTALACVALMIGQFEIAAACAGGMIGLVGGHLNGSDVRARTQA